MIAFKFLSNFRCNYTGNYLLIISFDVNSGEKRIKARNKVGNCLPIYSKSVHVIPLPGISMSFVYVKVIMSNIFIKGKFYDIDDRYFAN